MSLYYAPAFFSHLLGKCFRRKNPIFEVLKLGFVVIGIFALVWWPYIHSVQSVMEVNIHVVIVSMEKHFTSLSSLGTLCSYLDLQLYFFHFAIAEYIFHNLKFSLM